MTDRICYRYRTAVLCGEWRRHPETAHRDAIDAGQVQLNEAGEAWRVQGEIEASYCDRGGPCGGEYPPEDAPAG